MSAELRTSATPFHLLRSMHLFPSCLYSPSSLSPPLFPLHDFTGFYFPYHSWNFPITPNKRLSLIFQDVYGVQEETHTHTRLTHELLKKPHQSANVTLRRLAKEKIILSSSSFPSSLFWPSKGISSCGALLWLIRFTVHILVRSCSNWWQEETEEEEEKEEEPIPIYCIVWGPM